MAEMDVGDDSDDDSGCSLTTMVGAVVPAELPAELPVELPAELPAASASVVNVGYADGSAGSSAGCLCLTHSASRAEPEVDGGQFNNPSTKARKSSSPSSSESWLRNCQPLIPCGDSLCGDLRGSRSLSLPRRWKMFW